MGFRKNIDNEILDFLIGNLQTYIQYRTRHAKKKFYERFYPGSFYEELKDDLKPNLFPHLDLIPSNYLYFLNFLNASKFVHGENSFPDGISSKKI